MSFSYDHPIGVFDSGVGGLSVLRHLYQQLPYANFLYCADTAFAPYGEKSTEFIVNRTLLITKFMVSQGVQALVIACNTATAAAIHLLRSSYPNLIIVGVEPGLKPAVLLTRNHIVGVLATQSTLNSDKFRSLHAHITRTHHTHFLLQPCIGLADQIEKGMLDSPEIAALVGRYVTPLIEQGADTLVLGCTHYPFVQTVIEHAAQKISNTPIHIIDTGASITHQLIRLLSMEKSPKTYSDIPTLRAVTTGNPTALRSAFQNLLKLNPVVEPCVFTEV